MVQPIHLDISCTDCFKGVMCCSGNDNRRIVRTESGLQTENRRVSLVRGSLFGSKRKRRLENEAARHEFNVYLVQKYNCYTDWEDKKSKALTASELNYLLELAEEHKMRRASEQSTVRTSQPEKIQKKPSVRTTVI